MKSCFHPTLHGGQTEHYEMSIKVDMWHKTYISLHSVRFVSAS